MVNVVFALLEKDTALEICREAGQEVTSANPVVRGIIDNGLGYVSLAKSRPDDKTEERVIRIETENPAHAIEVLATIPGVKKVAPHFRALVA